jgi:hypothetical protein
MGRDGFQGGAVAGVQIIVERKLERKWSARITPNGPHMFQLLRLQAHKLAQLLLLCKVQRCINRVRECVQHSVLACSGRMTVLARAMQ